MWFWLRYKYRRAGNPLNASSWIVIIWFSLRKIECSWLKPRNACDGTSLIWLKRRSLKGYFWVEDGSFPFVCERQWEGRERRNPTHKWISLSALMPLFHVIHSFFITSPRGHNFLSDIRFFSHKSAFVDAAAMSAQDKTRLTIYCCLRLDLRGGGRGAKGK